MNKDKQYTSCHTHYLTGTETLSWAQQILQCVNSNVKSGRQVTLARLIPDNLFWFKVTFQKNLQLFVTSLLSQKKSFAMFSYIFSAVAKYVQ